MAAVTMNQQHVTRESDAIDIDRQTPQDLCRRCGTCCKKGGPALHREDRELIETGRIPLKHLFTIRKDEPAYDNINNTIQPAQTDIIKVKSKVGGKECVFYNPDDSGCRIYRHRPVECRKLLCRDTREILAVYNKDRITRTELLDQTRELLDLVLDHQARCSYPQIASLADRIKRRDPEACQIVSHMIQYDNSLRHLLNEKSPNLSETIEFLLGRPLTVTISAFGIK
jgi:Fe-S-cluster containining protein